jgi:hypothetical protein
LGWVVLVSVGKEIDDGGMVSDRLPTAFVDVMMIRELDVEGEKNDDILEVLLVGCGHGALLMDNGALKRR